MNKEPVYNYSVIKMTLSNKPKIYAAIFPKHGIQVLTLKKNFKQYESLKPGITDMLEHFGKSYLSDAFKKDFLLHDNDVSISIRGHPKDTIEMATYIALLIKQITKKEVQECIDKENEDKKV